jgi:hypothetical protein
MKSELMTGPRRPGLLAGSKLILGSLLLASCAGRAEILDRIAVTVGKQVITEGDVIKDVRVSAMLDQKPLDLSPEQRRKSAERLVDQALILQEATFSRVAAPSAEDAARLLQQVKSQYADEAAYQAALARYQVNEDDLMHHLASGLLALRFTDLRFRPEIETTPREVRDLYEKMAADWRRENAPQVPTFEASREQIEKLLIDQRVTQALDRWLSMQRIETKIVYREAAFT